MNYEGEKMPERQTGMPTKKQIADARKYIHEHEFEIRVHAICQLLGYTRRVRELEARRSK